MSDPVRLRPSNPSLSALSNVSTQPTAPRAEVVAHDTFAPGALGGRVAPSTAAPVVQTQVDPISGETLAPSKTLPEPSLMTAQAQDTKYSYALEQMSGPLFNGTASPDDIHQGAAGDCYFLSSLAAIAQSDPSAVQKLIHQNKDGSYSVTFHSWNDTTHKWSQKTVHVDAQFFVTRAKNNPTYGFSTYDGSGERYWSTTPDAQTSLWGPLIEKAYAEYKGGSYENIGEGGWPHDAMRELLGRQSQTVDTTQATPDSVWSFIQSAVSTKSPICASTFCDEDKQAQYTNSGIVGAHAYTVMGCEEKDGERYVKLRNPWGQSEPGNDGADDGDFEISLNDFLKYYQTVDSSQSHKRAA